MKKYLSISVLILLAYSYSVSMADNDARRLVQLPEMMQQHMMSNMRDHLVAINEILISMTKCDFEKTADVAEYRLGVSSLESRGAGHMAKFMPEGMRQAGTAMHKAASRFALKAQEEEVLPAYNALSEVTSACVACHRVRLDRNARQYRCTVIQGGQHMKHALTQNWASPQSLINPLF